MGRRWIVIVGSLVVLATTLALPSPAAARRRSVRCCLEVDAGDGAGVRTSCFVLRVQRGAPVGPKPLCRLLGGRPDRP
jgi:hypothetical protein